MRAQRSYEANVFSDLCMNYVLPSLMFRTTGLASEDHSGMTDIEFALEHELISLKVCM